MTILELRKLGAAFGCWFIVAFQPLAILALMHYRLSAQAAGALFLFFLSACAASGSLLVSIILMWVDPMDHRQPAIRLPLVAVTPIFFIGSALVIYDFLVGAAFGDAPLWSIIGVGVLPFVYTGLLYYAHRVGLFRQPEL